MVATTQSHDPHDEHPEGAPTRLRRQARARSPTPVSAQGPHTWENDHELGFSLLNDATDRKLVKPLLAHLQFVRHNLLPVPEQRDQPAEQDPPILSNTILACDLPTRAPPSSLLS